MWLFIADATETLIFFAIENMKKLPSKVGQFSRIAENSVLPKMARSTQKQKSTRLILFLILLCMYNFGLGKKVVNWL